MHGHRERLGERYDVRRAESLIEKIFYGAASLNQIMYFVLCLLARSAPRAVLHTPRACAAPASDACALRVLTSSTPHHCGSAPPASTRPLSCDMSPRVPQNTTHSDVNPQEVSRFSLSSVLSLRSRPASVCTPAARPAYQLGHSLATAKPQPTS